MNSLPYELFGDISSSYLSLEDLFRIYLSTGNPDVKRTFLDEFKKRSDIAEPYIFAIQHDNPVLWSLLPTTNVVWNILPDLNSTDVGYFAQILALDAKRIAIALTKQQGIDALIMAFDENQDNNITSMTPGDVLVSDPELINIARCHLRILQYEPIYRFFSDKYTNNDIVNFVNDIGFITQEGWQELLDNAIDYLGAERPDVDFDSLRNLFVDPVIRRHLRDKDYSFQDPSINPDIVDLVLEDSNPKVANILHLLAILYDRIDVPNC